MISISLPKSTVQRESEKFVEDGSGKVCLRVKQTTDSPPLPSGAATESKQDDVISELDALNSLVPSVYDYISLSYTGDNLTGVVFKNGGAGGSTISTLTLGYAGSNLTSVTKT